MLRVVGQTGQSHKLDGIGSLETTAAYEHHRQLLEGYLGSHRIRNHSPKTITKEKAFLESWFEEHGIGDRPLYTWEAMEPVVGRKRIVDYGNTLIESGLSSDTVRAYLGILSRYFSYVLEHPFVHDKNGPMRVNHHYGMIDQPVSEFDMPVHVYDGERLGVPLDPERLYDFYAVLRKEYLAKSSNKTIAARNYAMAVLAGESGLRADELMHLEMGKDLFFESKKLQTRFAKATRGSGKRARITLFTPLARDTLKFYLNEHRPKILNAEKTDFVFPSRSGQLLSYAGIHGALSEMVAVANKAGFSVAPHMGWHWFRRIFATRFIERFPNQLSTLIELMGHMSPNTIHRYIRHSSAWMDKQMQLVLERGADVWPSIGD